MSAPKGNKNAAIKPGDQRHGFYAEALLDGEGEAFEDAKSLPIDNEIALLRVRVRRAALAEARGVELPEGTQGQVDRALGRLRDFMMAKSIMLRNEREAGTGDDQDFDRFVDVATRTGAHRTTFKTNGNGNGKARNGKSNGS